MKSLISTAATGAADGTGITKEINMNTRRLMAIALTLSLPAAGLLAQNDGPPPQNPSSPSAPGRPGPRRGFRPPPPLIAVLDANHDGIISADEIANASKSLLTLDKNGDGQLTQDELRPHRPPPPRAEGDGQQDGSPPQGGGPDGPPDGPPPGPPPGSDRGDFHPPVSPIMAALDTNGDGIFSADEIANASQSLLKLDKNGDGQLTPDEYRPHHPGPDHQPPPGDGNNN